MSSQSKPKNKKRLGAKPALDRGIAESLEEFKVGRISFASSGKEFLQSLHRDAAQLALERRLRQLERRVAELERLEKHRPKTRRMIRARPAIPNT